MMEERERKAKGKKAKERKRNNFNTHTLAVFFISCDVQQPTMHTFFTNMNFIVTKKLKHFCNNYSN